MREVNGTLNDVYGVKRVHRLSVVINKNGDIKTIYCVPCGPLSYLQQSEDSSSTASNDLKDTKEDEYTKVLLVLLLLVLLHSVETRITENSIKFL